MDGHKTAIFLVFICIMSRRIGRDERTGWRELERRLVGRWLGGREEGKGRELDGRRAVRALGK